MFVDNYQSFLWLVWPELILVVLATWIIVCSAFQRSRLWWTGFAALVYVIVLGILSFQETQYLGNFESGQGMSNGPLAVDALGHGVRWLAVVLGLLFSLNFGQPDKSQLTGEKQGLLMLLVVGVMLAASANELTAIFLGLELISIPTYILLFLGRNDRASAEATAKYFFLSIFSSAMLLYGFSFLYGMAGSTHLVDIHAALQAKGGLTALSPIAAVLILAGLGFKIAAAPFHFYAPDVYQGATNINAGLLAIAPKIAGVAALARLAAFVAPEATSFGWPLVLALSLLTMTIGNVCALWQTNIRRMMAYSSIAHAGYMLIGLAAAIAANGSGEGGVAAMLVYLTMYSFASLAVFSALSYLSGDGRQIDEIDQLAGVGRSQPLAGSAIAIGMFSLAGIPPLAGFWGKFAIFGSAIEVARTSGADLSWWFIVLAIVGAINAAIAAVYYLNVVSTVYFRASHTAAPSASGWGPLASTCLCVVAVCIFGALPRPVMHMAKLAERTAASAAQTPAPSADEIGYQSPDSAP